MKKFNEILLTEAKQPMDQIRADAVQHMELNDFMELEGKKYKKTDDIDDILNELK
ncbi:hypothetical protein [Sedimentibacter sp.]|uniref:hypothetical protein n=1 Tax=Sedimentibacter sp. TaxID=1960295 RepID=UPI0028964294|nr:hypothetical protein [Sedimentibacter sp.]